MKRGIFGIILGGLGVIIIASTYAYAQRPQRAVSNAVHKLAFAQTEHFHAVISLGKTQAAQSLLQEATDLVLTLDGSFDRRGEERDSLASDITVNAKGDSVTLELNGELRLIADKAYLLVKKAPAAVPLLAKLKDQWAELPRGQVSENAAAPASGPLFQEAKRSGREAVNGHSAIKYQAIVTEAGIVSFMNHIAQILGTQLTNDQVGQLRQNLANIESLPVALWVTPWGHELVQLEAQLPSSGGRYTISFSDRNKPVNHEIPPNAQPIRDILGS